MNATSELALAVDRDGRILRIRQHPVNIRDIGAGNDFFTLFSPPEQTEAQNWWKRILTANGISESVLSCQGNPLYFSGALIGEQILIVAAPNRDLLYPVFTDELLGTARAMMGQIEQLNREITDLKTGKESHPQAFFTELSRVNNEMANLQREMARKNAELENALSKVKLLSGLIPICASCKRIRDDQGYWEQVEKYISEHSMATFSHGLCSDCMQKLYPEYYSKHQENQKKLS